jgi:hypothetical protein
MQIDELHKTKSRFRSGHKLSEVQCIAYVPGTLVTLANKGSLDLQTHVK